MQTPQSALLRKRILLTPSVTASSAPKPSGNAKRCTLWVFGMLSPQLLGLKKVNEDGSVDFKGFLFLSPNRLKFFLGNRIWEKRIQFR